MRDLQQKATAVMMDLVIRNIRPLTHRTLSPQIVEMQRNAETMVERVQQKELAVAVPVAVRQQWRGIQREL